MVLATQYNYPYINVADRLIDQEVIELIPTEIAHRYKIVSFAYDEGNDELSLAIVPPKSINSVSEELAQVLQRNVKLVLTSPSQIEKALDMYYPVSA